MIAASAPQVAKIGCHHPDSELTIRKALALVAWTVLALAVLGLVAGNLAITNHYVLLTVVVSPLLAFGAPIAVVIFAAIRRWRALALAAVVTIAIGVIALPMFVPAAARPDSVPLRVLTANLYLGGAGMKAVAAEAIGRADVFAAQELTAEAVDRLNAAGMAEHFPYHALDARDLASGVGIWSRYPIVESHRIEGYELAMVGARIRLAGVQRDAQVVVAHLAGPWPQPIDGWRRDLERMSATMQEAVTAAAGGCVLIAGDFNSTVEMKPFRQLLDQGFADAAEQSGAGLIRTYPANLAVPPLIGIDHVLISQCTAVSLDTVELPGSDHRGLVATISVPRSPAESG